MEHSGVFGHSFGGATAAEAVRVDPRFAAGINMDGTPFQMTAQGAIDRPFLWMVSDYSHVTEDQLARIHMSRADFDAKLEKREKQRNPFLPQLKQGRVVTLPGSTHNTFTSDNALLSALIPGMNDPLAAIGGREANAIINRYVVEFFNEHLKHSVSNADGQQSHTTDVR
jgi:predicted dienelactone hydrolase